MKLGLKSRKNLRKTEGKQVYDEIGLNKNPRNLDFSGVVDVDFGVIVVDVAVVDFAGVPPRFLALVVLLSNTVVVDRRSDVVVEGLCEFRVSTIFCD